MDIFDNDILKTLDWSKSKATYKSEISPEELPDGFQVRALNKADYKKGYCTLLDFLTKVGDVSETMFLSQFEKMRDSDMYYIVVIEDKNKGQLAGTATLLIEHKFIHTTANRGRIEDLVIHPDYQGMEFGKLLVDILILVSEAKNCYKLSLDCNDQVMGFYQKFDLKHKQDHRFMYTQFYD